ncbi:hypothetical protein QE152_g27317 [Popillia japonica]|uniref:Uncharacterized protein n=1 Tax=Popillia japonica TaxID=7064 RepID=A0AAW1JVA8_POPJA
MGAPMFSGNPITIRGLGNVETRTLGKFMAHVTIDSHQFSTDVHVVSDEAIPTIVRNEFLEKIKVAQKEDEHLKAIIEILQKQPYDDYEMDKDILYKQKNGLRLLVVPTNMQRQIITCVSVEIFLRRCTKFSINFY